MKNETIAAISTAQGKGGIAVIRVSGDDSIGICDKIFRSKERLMDAKSHTIHYGYIVKDNEEQDEVLVSVMRAPRTFTREDVVEISTHGGYVAAGKVLDALFWAGAKPAEPGEFTKRAFLNGRIDLSQAEAVIDIINAKGELAHKNALSHAKGQLGKKINQIRDSLTHLAASMQVAIDYPDEDLEEITKEDIIKSLQNEIENIERLTDSARRGKLIKDGIKTAIIGRPNVGKSSLLNSITMQDRAIVTDIAGTTRDVIEETVEIDGLMLRLMDTAGIRTTEDEIEKIGVEKSLEFIESADLILLVFDLKQGITNEDRELLEKVKDKNTIILANKCDVAKEEVIEGAIRISAKTGKGMDLLYTEIKNMFLNNDLLGSEITLTNDRHKLALDDAKKALARGKETLFSGMEQDFAALDINEAIYELGKIDGKSVSEDIVNAVFHDFCVGK